MADLVIHRAPSVGSVVKKIMAINPELTAHEMISLVKQATKPQGAGEFASAEVIDEAKALRLAQETTLKTRGHS
jgi:hypothetical protein